MTPDQHATVTGIIARLTGSPEVLDEPDLDLFEAGLMDSMGTVELLFALEEDLGLSVAPTEVDRSDINTVNRILAFVDERL